MNDTNTLSKDLAILLGRYDELLRYATDSVEGCIYAQLSRPQKDLVNMLAAKNYVFIEKGIVTRKESNEDIWMHFTGR